ncbi:unnamed protein product [Paramecium octaurelia]|uniref:Uncharacterized protein n=1 Tax=Paramecium octaurelia TaxID=43137 RepID=A0A8S1VIY5_PAROT|nr:unnamed protein product [Paramecium octaurelia]
MKLHQCQTNQPNNDIIFGHRIGTKKIVAEKQQKLHSILISLAHQTYLIIAQKQGRQLFS